MGGQFPHHGLYCVTDVTHSSSQTRNTQDECAQHSKAKLHELVINYKHIGVDVCWMAATDQVVFGSYNI